MSSDPWRLIRYYVEVIIRLIISEILEDQGYIDRRPWLIGHNINETMDVANSISLLWSKIARRDM